MDEVVFRQEMGELLVEMKRFGCPIAVLSLKPVGEHLDSTLNDRFVVYNKILVEVVAQQGCVLFDIDTPFREAVKNSTMEYRSPNVEVGDFYKPLTMVKVHALKALSFGWLSWTDIGRREGYTLMTVDGLHLNDEASVVVQDLVVAFLKESKLLP